MARDRLAAMRAQQQQQRGGAYDTDQQSYPTQQEGGGGYSRRANPYAQQDDRAYEMQDVHQSSTALVPDMGYTGNSGGNAGDMASFYSEIGSLQDDIRNFNDNVSRIGDLHSRSLNNTDDAAAQRVASELDTLVDDTSSLSGDLKRRIKALERKGAGADRDGQIRRQQTALVKQKFMEAIQQYQTVEQQYRQRYKQRMERQYKIVKPDATPEEVKAVVEDTQGGQVFQQALLSSNRQGESRAAYREVQARHEDIKRIEQTLTELAQLFNDMSILVEQQDEMVTNIETTAATAEKDLEMGTHYTTEAVSSARAARKKRWICCAFMIVLIIIVGIIIAVEVVQHLPSKSNSGGTKTVTDTTAAPTAAAASTAAALVAAVTGGVTGP